MELINLYTVESKEKNNFSPYVKKIKLYAGTKSNPLFLPTQPYVNPIGDRRIMRHKVKPIIDYKYTGTPSEEQILINQRIVWRLDKSYWCWLIELGTGKWKSHVIMQTIDTLKCSSLILVHNLKTLQEMKSKFKEFANYDVGIVWGWKKVIKDITVCTHDSFVKLYEELSFVNAIFVDECDTWLSKHFINALCNMRNAYYVYWLTWTPYRQDLDNNDMQLIYGKSIKVEWDSLEKYHYLPQIDMFRYKNSEYAYETFAELRDLMLADDDRIQQQVRLVEMLTQSRNVILVLTERVEEAARYAEKLSLYNPILITWETKVKDDEVALQRLNSKPARDAHIIIGTIWKMARWVDIPPIDTICLFASVHFRGTVIQAVWRALRKFPWKDNVRIVDFSDSELVQQFYSRRKAYMAEYNLSKTDIHVYNIN